MARIGTRFKGSNVYFWTAESEHPTKAFCKGIVTEAGEHCYLMVHEEGGLEEPVFVASIIRICSADKIEKAAEIYDLNVEKKKGNLRVVN